MPTPTPIPTPRPPPPTRSQDEHELTIPDEIKTQVKDNLLQLYLAVAELLQSQLSEAMALIASHDFPAKWQRLGLANPNPNPNPDPDPDPDPNPDPNPSPSPKPNPHPNQGMPEIFDEKANPNT